MVCRYWCETCRQPLVDEEHATDHRAIKGCKGVRQLFNHKIYSRNTFFCVCAERCGSREEFDNHRKKCEFAFAMRVRRASNSRQPIVVTRGMRHLYDDAQQKCCKCGEISMALRTRPDGHQKWYCGLCKTEVSQSTVCNS